MPDDLTEGVSAERALPGKDLSSHKVAELTPVDLNVFDLAKEQHKWFSPDVVDLLGYTPDEISRMDDCLGALIHPEDLPRLRENIARLRVLRDRESSEIECRVRRRDGEWRWVASRSMPFARDDAGQVRQTITASFDVTDKRRTDEELGRNEERFRLLIENSSDLITIIGSDRVIRYGSPSVTHILGYRTEEFIGQNVFDFVHPDDRSGMEAGFAYTFAQDGAVTPPFEGRFRSQNGSWRVLEGIGRTVVQASGETVGVFNSRDITERKLAESKLRESEKRHELVARATNDVIWDWDLPANGILWSRAVETVFGYPPDTVDEDFSWWSAHIHPGDRERVLRSLRDAIDAQGGADDHWQSEYRFACADGSYSWVFDRGFVAHDEQGQSVRMVGSMLDLTERRRVEAEREQLLLALKRSNEELSQFASTVSHDLQAPLRMVKSYAQLLAARYRGKLDEEADESIAAITGGAGSMEQLIRGLLRYAQSGVEEGERKSVAVNTVVRDVLANLEPELDETQAEISYGELPTVTVWDLQIKQLFQNLISNALKYREKSRPLRISISAERRDAFYLFAITDNGIGVEPEHQERIFQPLRRLHGPEIPGTGLGLAVCRKIVAHHGGQIWIESERGAGSTFYFTLPA